MTSAPVLSSAQATTGGRLPPVQLSKQDPTQDPEQASPNMAQTFTRSTAISVAVDPVALVTTECIAVTSAMRKHARWAHSSVSAILGGGPSAQSQFFEPSIPPSPRVGHAGPKKGQSLAGKTPLEGETGLAIRWGLRGKKGKSMQDNPLMSAFARLRNDLGGCQGQIDLPFLNTSRRRLTLVLDPRCSHLRHSFSSTSVPSGDPLLFHVGSNHLSRTRCHHQVFRLQSHQCRIAATPTRDAAALLRHHSLSL